MIAKALTDADCFPQVGFATGNAESDGSGWLTGYSEITS
jgi:hypothetical protein